MWDIGSPRAERVLVTVWVIFALANLYLMFALPGEETIPYHLIWASFALLYGLYAWSKSVTWLVFSAITASTGIALVKHAVSQIIGWEECSEIVLMGVLVALLIWHVDRHRLAQRRLNQLRETERVRAHNREVAARFGSHEVRTRLTIAHGFTELIRDASTDELQRSDAEVVLAELNKATALATKLLKFVRFETATSWTTMDLEALINRTVRRWTITTDRQWTDFCTVGQFAGDEERLEAAVDCLIENAVKFTVPGDAISVEAHVDGTDVQLSVRDSGVGIPADELHRITEIFQTGASAGSRAGSGLGLAIVSAVAEAHGGSLLVQSQPGSGTCVTLRLPLASAQPPTATPVMSSRVSDESVVEIDAAD